MKEEHLTPHYERRLNLVLERIDPHQFGGLKRRNVENNKYHLALKLTDANRQLLIKYYRKMCNENIAPARKHNVLGVISRLLEMLGKDFETSNQDDIEKLVAQINTKNIGSVTRQDYLKKLKQLDKWLNGGKEWSDKTKWISTKLGKKHYKLPSQLITPEEALIRECKEEFGISVKDYFFVASIIYKHIEVDFKLNYFVVTKWTGKIKKLEADELIWSNLDDLSILDLEVDKKAISELIKSFQN